MSASGTGTAAPSPVGYVKLFKDILAGTCGGITVTLVGHPFDTIKVRLQTQPSINPMYSGMVDCARKTVQWEGFAGLYKGVTSPLAGQMFFRATLFGVFGEAKRWLGRDPDGNARPLQILDFYKAGAITGFASAFIEGPIDFYKSQIQVQIIKAKQDPLYKPPYTTVSACVRATFRESGIRGPFQGLGATILRNTPANSIYLGSFEVMKRMTAEAYGCQVSDLSGSVVVAAAGTGGLMYWLTIFPVDQIKSAMQTDAIRKPDRKFNNVLHTAKALYKDGGIPRFYRGFTPCIARAMPANGLMLLTVERVSNLLNS